MTDLLYMTDAYLRDFDALSPRWTAKRSSSIARHSTRAVEDNPTTWDG